MLTIVDYSVNIVDLIVNYEEISMNKHIGQIDPKTGEIMNGCMVYIPYRPKLKERWFMAFQDGLEEIAKDPELTLVPKNVLLYLYSKLDFENFIEQTQKEIAQALGIHKEQISRAMKLLIKKQIILESSNSGRSKFYRLNPNYGWKGKTNNLNEYRLKVIQGNKDG